jgi:hypothetical protein
VSRGQKKPQDRGNGAGAHVKSDSRIAFNNRSAATEAQRDRILSALMRRPQTSYDLRLIGCYQAPTRIKELRDDLGHCIETTRVTVVDNEGYTHRGVALYSLKAAADGGER